MKGLVVRLFGVPSVHVDGAQLKLPMPPRCMSLLAMLAVRRGDPQSRASLAAAMWPDDLDADARANLRRHLHLLLQALPKIDGVEWIRVTTRSIEWNEEAPAWIDVRAFEDSVDDSQ